MVTFADTSGLYALLDRNDDNHSMAASFWRVNNHRANALTTTNYVVLECHTLMQQRLGMQAAAVFQSRIVPMLSIHWISETMHQQGVEQVLVANRRQLSLVDCTSFATMRSRGIDAAFAFDQHFAEQGFRLFPEGV